mgnify:CR=1 FL=1
MRLSIERDWEGLTVPEIERAWIQCSRRGEQLAIEFEAAYFADPPPPCAAGPTPGLWDHEVIELFLADAAEHYLELEFGPHGHHLALELQGVRQVVRQGLPLRYTPTIEGSRYRGVAEVPMSYLPGEVTRGNAYVIHGVGAGRRYLAHAPVPGSRPDFHRLGCFVPLTL